MATPEALAKKRAVALDRLRTVITAMSETLGIDPVDIPQRAGGTDVEHLQAEQLSRMAGWLESVFMAVARELGTDAVKQYQQTVGALQPSAALPEYQDPDLGTYRNMTVAELQVYGQQFGIVMPSDTQPQTAADQVAAAKFRAYQAALGEGDLDKARLIQDTRFQRAAPISQETDYESMTLVQLKQLADERGVVLEGSMRKAEVIAALRQEQPPDAKATKG
jgi:hypothetical protein